MTVQPKEIEILRDLVEKCGVEAIDNFYLRLNKGMEYERYKIKSDTKAYKAIIKDRKYKNGYDFIKKQDYLIKQIASQGYEVAQYKFTPFNKIIVGLGQESVREISMTLHWIYGIPFIPGQAIKGAVSNWIGNEKSKDENYNLIFGNEESKGVVIFLDSYPENWNFDINLDIINSHYNNYYSGNKPPSDWQSPNLIQFLALEKVSFKIYLIYLKEGTKDKKIGGKTLEKWLKEALKYGGIGAKTASGYGKGELVPIKGD